MTNTWMTRTSDLRPLLGLLVSARAHDQGRAVPPVPPPGRARPSPTHSRPASGAGRALRPAHSGPRGPHSGRNLLSWRLVGEVLVYTSRRLDPPMHSTDRFILVTIAEEIRDPHRRCTPGSGVLAEKVGLSRIGLRRALQRLAKRGLEVRVPLMIGADGRAVFAVPGQLQTYRIPPLLDSSSQVRQGGTQVPPGGTQVPPGGTPGAARQHLEGVPSPFSLNPLPPPVDDEPSPAVVDELVRVVVGTLRGKAPTPGQQQLRRECSRLARLQWTPAQLQAVIEGHDWTGARAGAVITHLRRLQAPSAAPELAPDRPDWCGGCDQTTRLLTDVHSGLPRRCPTCHPLTHRKDA